MEQHIEILYHEHVSFDHHCTKEQHEYARPTAVRNMRAIDGRGTLSQRAHFVLVVLVSRTGA